MNLSITLWCSYVSYVISYVCDVDVCDCKHCLIDESIYLIGFMKIRFAVATHLGGNIVNKYTTIQVDAIFLFRTI